MTEDEIAKELSEQGWVLTRVGEVWHITPAADTHEVTSLREAEMFGAGLIAGWLGRAELDPAD